MVGGIEAGDKSAMKSCQDASEHTNGLVKRGG